MVGQQDFHARHRVETHYLQLASFKGTASNAWVVGWRAGYGALALHWNGKTWTSTEAPEAAPKQGFVDVYAASKNNAMAVGTGLKNNGTSLTTVTYAHHWNGKTWKATTLPAGTSSSVFLTSVVGASTGNYWAAGGPASALFGSTGTAVPGTSRATYYRYTSGAWHVVHGPSRASGNGVEPFTLVLAMAHVQSTDEDWAVGFLGNNSCDGDDDAQPCRVSGPATIDHFS